MRDYSLKHLIGGKSDGVPDLLLFQILVHLWLGKSSVTPEQQPQSFLLVSFHHRLKKSLLAIGAMDVAGSQRRSFTIPKLVE